MDKPHPWFLALNLWKKSVADTWTFTVSHFSSHCLTLSKLWAKHKDFSPFSPLVSLGLNLWWSLLAFFLSWGSFLNFKFFKSQIWELAVLELTLLRSDNWLLSIWFIEWRTLWPWLYLQGVSWKSEPNKKKKEKKTTTKNHALQTKQSTQPPSPISISKSNPLTALLKPASECKVLIREGSLAHSTYTDVIHCNISSVSPVNHFVYNCNDLLHLCPFYLDFCVWIWNQPRNWKHHGKRAGKLLKVKEANRTMNIPSTVCWWTFVNSYLLTNSRRSINLARLVPIKSDARAYNL